MRERRSTWLFEAMDAPFDDIDALKERRNRWNGDWLLWRKERADDQREAELDWATIPIYRATRSPDTTLIDWRARHVVA